MARDLAISNGRLLVMFDREAVNPCIYRRGIPTARPS
jgi:hypothetical protein